MPLWFAITLGLVAALAIGVTGMIAYILLSLGQAAPMIRTRIGRQPRAIMVFGREPGRLTFAMVAPQRRRTRSSQWANAHYS